MSRSNDGLPMLPPWLADTEVAESAQGNFRNYEPPPVENLPQDEVIPETPEPANGFFNRRGRGDERAADGDKKKGKGWFRNKDRGEPSLEDRVGPLLPGNNGPRPSQRNDWAEQTGQHEWATQAPADQPAPPPEADPSAGLLRPAPQQAGPPPSYPTTGDPHRAPESAPQWGPGAETGYPAPAPERPRDTHPAPPSFESGQPRFDAGQQQPPFQAPPEQASFQAPPDEASFQAPPEHASFQATAAQASFQAPASSLPVRDPSEPAPEFDRLRPHHPIPPENARRPDTSGNAGRSEGPERAPESAPARPGLPPPPPLPDPPATIGQQPFQRLPDPAPTPAEPPRTGGTTEPAQSPESANSGANGVAATSGADPAPADSGPIPQSRWAEIPAPAPPPAPRHGQAEPEVRARPDTGHDAPAESTGGAMRAPAPESSRAPTPESRPHPADHGAPSQTWQAPEPPAPSTGDNAPGPHWRTPEQTPAPGPQQQSRPGPPAPPQHYGPQTGHRAPGPQTGQSGPVPQTGHPGPGPQTGRPGPAPTPYPNTPPPPQWQNPAPGPQHGGMPPNAQGMPPAAQWQQQQQHPGQLGGPGAGGPSLDDVAVRRAKKPAGQGWRKVVHHASGGRINPGMSAEERRMLELVARIRQPVRGDYRIAVLSLKGGVGKTTTTIGLGSTFASVRGDRVIAVDANPDFGTLSQRVPMQTRSTVRDLLLDPAIQRYSDVRRHTSQATSRLEVLASERDPAASEAFNEDEYRAVARILQRFYNIILTDCGTGLMHSAMAGVLQLAHSLVLISPTAIDGAQSASATLDWLSLHGYHHLVQNAVVVINSPRDGTPNIDVQQLRQYFLSRCRAVHMVPFDPHMSEGAEIDLPRLKKETKRAYVELAATVADDFTQSYRSPQG
ncbi:AAA family ATPase [Nocardia sp. NPDC024068]|uniref:MinD/ParA family ATP-binding protein n=1 Tax=Nocardia sp. NPDC024068 TaxID=3157197 RepID=UPI003410F434